MGKVKETTEKKEGQFLICNSTEINVCCDTIKEELCNPSIYTIFERSVLQQQPAHADQGLLILADSSPK